MTLKKENKNVYPAANGLEENHIKIYEIQGVENFNHKF
jgi:hypothetical protein